MARFDISLLGSEALSQALAALPENLERKVLQRALRNAGKFYKTGRSFRQRFRRQYRRRLLRHDARASENARRRDRKRFSETARRIASAVGFFDLFSPALRSG